MEEEKEEEQQQMEEEKEEEQQQQQQMEHRSKPSFMERIGKEFVQKIVSEIQRKEHMEIYERSILQPLIKHTYHQVYPYILFTSIVFLLTFLMAVAILFMLARWQYLM